MVGAVINLRPLVLVRRWTEVYTIIELILGLYLANERRRYKVTPSLIGWA